jgi:RHS repeat-associated protein
MAPLHVEASDYGWVFGFQPDPMDSSTGHVDMGSRWYEPALGLFDSGDPLLGEVTDPLSLNQYVYGWDSPLTYSDSTGTKIAMTTCGGSCDSRCHSEIDVEVEALEASATLRSEPAPFDPHVPAT